MPLRGRSFVSIHCINDCVNFNITTHFPCTLWQSCVRVMQSQLAAVPYLFTNPTHWLVRSFSPWMHWWFSVSLAFHATLARLQNYPFAGWLFNAGIICLKPYKAVKLMYWENDGSATFWYGFSGQLMRAYNKWSRVPPNRLFVRLVLHYLFFKFHSLK